MKKTFRVLYLIIGMAGFVSGVIILLDGGLIGLMNMILVWALDLYKLRDIDYNVQMGVLILKKYLDNSGGDVGKALFRYWGGNADRHGMGYPVKVLGSKYFR